MITIKNEQKIIIFAMLVMPKTCLDCRNVFMTNYNEYYQNLKALIFTMKFI